MYNTLKKTFQKKKGSHESHVTLSFQEKMTPKTMVKIQNAYDMISAMYARVFLNSWG